jgi:hypothetical protein
MQSLSSDERPSKISEVHLGHVTTLEVFLPLLKERWIALFSSQSISLSFLSNKRDKEGELFDISLNYSPFACCQATIQGGTFICSLVVDPRVSAFDRVVAFEIVEKLQKCATNFSDEIKEARTREPSNLLPTFLEKAFLPEHSPFTSAQEKVKAIFLQSTYLDYERQPTNGWQRTSFYGYLNRYSERDGVTFIREEMTYRLEIDQGSFEMEHSTRDDRARVFKHLMFRFTDKTKKETDRERVSIFFAYDIKAKDELAKLRPAYQARASDIIKLVDEKSIPIRDLVLTNLYKASKFHLEDLYQRLLQGKASSMSWEMKKGRLEKAVTGNERSPYSGPGLILRGKDAHGYRVKVELAENRSDPQQENFSVINIAFKEASTSDFSTNDYRRMSNEEKIQLTKGLSQIIPSLQTVLPTTNIVWNRLIKSILKFR